jgi:tetratricopeptide (TPR) repeat protein
MQLRTGKNMFSRQCMKFGSTALLLFAALAAGGCAMQPQSTATYTPTLEDTRDLSPAQASELLIKAAQTDVLCIDPRTVSVTYKKIEITCAKGSVKEWRSLRIVAKPALAMWLGTDLVIPFACVYVSGSDNRCMFNWRGGSAASAARDFVRAWFVLAGAVDPAQEAAFERAAQSYRNAQVKPQLPEEAVKYKVQAELAVQQKRFDDAVDLYDQALGIAPWWPAGHYNRGLILGELQDYQGGIRALQKYLKLEPDASNARAVQLRIYQWESLVPRGGK